MTVNTEIFDFTVERLSEEHLEFRVLWINNPSINKNMYFQVPVDIDSTVEWFKSASKNPTRIDVVFKFKNTLLAMGGLTNISERDKNAEFHLMVNPDIQGKGIGERATIWLFNYGFSVLQLNKIYLYTNEDNVFANKLYDKLEFNLEGVLRNHTWKNDKYNNRKIYALLKEEWAIKKWMQILKYAI